MTNEERRIALAKARREALRHAETASLWNKQKPKNIEIEFHKYHRGLANMWANVAQALKVGEANGPDSIIDS